MWSIFVFVICRRQWNFFVLRAEDFGIVGSWMWSQDIKIGSRFIHTFKRWSKKQPPLLKKKGRAGGRSGNGKKVIKGTCRHVRRKKENIKRNSKGKAVEVVRREREWKKKGIYKSGRREGKQLTDAFIIHIHRLYFIVWVLWRTWTNPGLTLGCGGSSDIGSAKGENSLSGEKILSCRGVEKISSSCRGVGRGGRSICGIGFLRGGGAVR